MRKYRTLEFPPVALALRAILGGRELPTDGTVMSVGTIKPMLGRRVVTVRYADGTCVTLFRRSQVQLEMLAEYLSACSVGHGWHITPTRQGYSAYNARSREYGPPIPDKPERLY